MTGIKTRSPYERTDGSLQKSHQTEKSRQYHITSLKLLRTKKNIFFNGRSFVTSKKLRLIKECIAKGEWERGEESISGRNFRESMPTGLCSFGRVLLLYCRGTSVIVEICQNHRASREAPWATAISPDCKFRMQFWCRKVASRVLVQGGLGSWI